MDTPTTPEQRYLSMLQEEKASDMPMAVQLVLAAPFAMVISDPSQDDNPIVFVNKAFEDSTGYSMADAIGRNCRFLQGKDTDKRAPKKIREAVAAEKEVSVDILNYRKDGSPFWNRLLIAPLRDESGKAKYFFGVQKVLGELPGTSESGSIDFLMREIQHRVKNHLTMVVGLIRMQSRENVNRDGYDKLARRVESLQLLYEELNVAGGENHHAVALGSYLSRIVRSIAELDEKENIKLHFDVESFVVPLDTAVRCGMIVSEAVTNAMQHAFVGRESGRIVLHVRRNRDRSVEVVVTDNGIGIPDGFEWPRPESLGGRILIGLAETLDGTISMSSTGDGSVMRLTLPDPEA